MCSGSPAYPEAIAVEALSKTYYPRKRPPVRALQSLTMTVSVGQAVGILGSPGAGKTTAIKLLAGLIKPTAGRVRLNGYDLAHEPGAARRQRGVVLGSSRTVVHGRSVWETLLDAGNKASMPPVLDRPELAGRATHLLHELDLAAWRDEPLDALPSGVQRRVALVRAVLLDPPILLLDEPTRNLAAAEASDVIAAVRAIRTPSRTIVLATSQLALACDLCDHNAILHHGRLVAKQTVPDLLGLLQQERYEIVVQSQLDRRWASWFDGMTLRHTEQGETVLSGVVADQAALYGLLTKVRNLNLPLVSVKRIDPDLDEGIWEPWLLSSVQQ